MSAFYGKKDTAVSWQCQCIDKAKTMQCLFIEDILFFSEQIYCNCQRSISALAVAVYLKWATQYYCY